MAIMTIGIDLAKNVFAVHGVDENGKVLLVKPKVARKDLAELIARQPPCLIGMEACTGAHHWARQFRRYGHTVRLIAPKFVTPYRMSGRNSLWGFYSAKPAKEDGFPWLASRRNMLVHRLHLRPIEGKKEDDFYQAMYDNLEETVRNKLKPAHPEKEVEMLIAQWSKINELFSDVLDVVERAAETRHKPIS